MDKIEMLHNVCEVLTDEMEEVSKKLDKAGGMSAGDLETVDKLAHALKSIKTTIAMMESEDGYSGRYYPMGGMAYNDGGSYNDGMSYARGRTGNVRRDSMGRYSSRGYSRAEDGIQELIGEMRDMMGSLPDDKRREVQRFIDRMS
jgi:hypothetical protein